MEYVFDLSDPYEYRMEKALDLLNRDLIPNCKSMALRACLRKIPRRDHRFRAAVGAKEFEKQITVSFHTCDHSIYCFHSISSLRLYYYYGWYP